MEYLIEHFQEWIPAHNSVVKKPTEPPMKQAQSINIFSPQINKPIEYGQKKVPLINQTKG
jgi:hypothetical protein